LPTRFFAAVPPGSSENAAPAFLSLRKSAAVDFPQTINRASCRFQIDLLHGTALVIAVDAKDDMPAESGVEQGKGYARKRVFLGRGYRLCAGV